MTKPAFYVEGIPVYQKFMSPSQSNFPAHPMKPEYITVHETDNYSPGADAEAHAVYLLNSAWGRKASWHFTVDDICIYQHAKVNQSTWAAGDGDGPGNRKSIHIEICVNSDGNFQKAVRNAQALIRYLMKRQGIPLKNVKPHKHWSGKNCPRTLLPGWGKFIKEIESSAEVVQVAQPKKPANNTNYSIVDYLKSRGIDSSKENRKKLAKEYGVKNYDFSAAKNLELLRRMQLAEEQPETKKNPKPNVAEYKGNSIVDYLISIGQDPSKENRKKLAKEYGIDNYDFSAAKNLELLRAMRSGKKKTSSGSKQKKGTVHLPKHVEYWGTYKLDVLPVKKNIDWYLRPSRYGGLTYEILDEPYPNVVTIQTSRGKRNIYVGPDTPAIIKK